VRVFLLAFALALGCTSDHVIGSTTAPDAPMSVDANGDAPKDASVVDSGPDGSGCGGRREPCCTMGMPCQNGLCCVAGTCR